jgi:uncharacterized membrane protein YhaH (DUF805 family)
MEWMLMPLMRYADFQGRSRRLEYWMFTLGVLVVAIVVGFLITMLGALGGRSSGGLFGGVGIVLLGLLWLALIIPSIALQVRRFHDQNLSGWFVLLNLIPYLGGLVVFVFMCLPGTRGPNRFGRDPLDIDGKDVAAIFE